MHVDQRGFVTPLQTNDWAPRGANYMVYNITILVEGDYAKIVPFISRLENELFGNLTIVSIEITQNKSEDALPDSARLNLAVYIGV